MPNYKGSRGQPSTRQGDNGVWYVHWSAGRRSKRQSLGTKDEATALSRFAQWILNEGWMKADAEEPGRSTYTISELWGVYVDKHVKEHVVGQATIFYAWKNLEPHFGPLTVDKFNQDQVDAYTKKRASGRIGRPSKSITVRREIATLLAALNFCAVGSKKLIQKASIETIRLPDGGHPRDRWLKMDEMQRLLKAAAEMRRQTADDKENKKPPRLSRGERFLWLGLETAARKEAILDLTWDRVDFEAGVIHYDVPGRHKTKKRRASVPISSALRPVLERALREKHTNLVLDHKADDLWATIQYIAIRAGFSEQKVASGASPKATGISPHVLRHTAATHMARRGVPLWVIAKILGNTLAMVEKVYAKWTPDNATDTVDLISGGLLEAAE